VQIDYIKITN